MNKLIEECMALGRRYGFEEEHSRQDARLAVQIFDQTTELHQLDDEYRSLLYCAGILHDIGYVDGYWGHHKTAYKLIMKADLSGVDKREKKIIACVARYHRGARPSLKHKGFASLEPEDREVVRMLGAILRLADGLDRGHTDAVEGLDVLLEGRRLILEVDCPYGCRDEMWAGEKKGRFFGELFGVDVQVLRR